MWIKTKVIQDFSLSDFGKILAYFKHQLNLSTYIHPLLLILLNIYSYMRSTYENRSKTK